MSTTQEPRQRATVIIPCYNVGAYIGECLDSVLAQGDAVDHVHCVDNGSSDGTVAAIERWRDAHPEQGLSLHHEAKRGACAARNKPLPEVATEWVQYLDADDLLLPGKIAEQLRHAADADVLYESNILRSVDGSESIREPQADPEVGLMAGELGVTSTNLWRTSALRAVNGWNESLSSSQEYDLMQRLYADGARFVKLDGCRSVKRDRASGQISHNAASTRWRNLVDVQARMMETCERLVDRPHDWPRLRQAFFGGLRLLYPCDPTHAQALHRRFLQPHGFVPVAGGVNSRAYVWAYRLAGFGGAERFKTVLGRLRGRQEDSNAASCAA